MPACFRTSPLFSLPPSLSHLGLLNLLSLVIALLDSELPSFLLKKKEKNNGGGFYLSSHYSFFSVFVEEKEGWYRKECKERGEI
jgi:hypothetical protein